jgi:hypothetical protein
MNGTRGAKTALERRIVPQETPPSELRRLPCFLDSWNDLGITICYFTGIRSSQSYPLSLVTMFKTWFATVA